MPRHEAAPGELLLIPTTRRIGRLLLRADDTFVYVCNAKATFGCGTFNVTGTYTREAAKVTLTAGYWDEEVDRLEPGAPGTVLEVTIGDEIEVKGTIASGVAIPEDGYWLNPDYEE